MCARRPAAGRTAGYLSPVVVIPSRVSQHHRGPGPSRPVATYPSRRHRASILDVPLGPVRSATASRSSGAP
ncbi:MAG: hypothetical protein ACRDP5_28590 [Streptosporangiaceae bacterium]